MAYLNERHRLNFVKGIALTFLIALIAKFLTEIPFLSIVGQLVLAILVGMALKSTIGIDEKYMPGIDFSNKKLLRIGIILLGMRLNIIDIYHAGLSVFVIAVINLVFALIVVYGISRWIGVEKKLGVLTACGTAICGAAAVVAIAPQIKANDNDTAVSAATVALLGTIFTIIYTILYPILHLSTIEYGVFSGGTLHEVAHVIAAAAVGGSDAVDMAIIVKLSRVALLVPVALILGFISQRSEVNKKQRKISYATFPWFIIGFIAMSGFNTLGIMSETTANLMVNVAYLLIAMAMAGLGLNVDLTTFRKLGSKALIAGLIGSVLLSGLGYMLVVIFFV